MVAKPKQIETLGKIAGRVIDFGKDKLDDLLESGIVKKFSDFEKMPPEDLAAAQALRERQLLEAKTNNPRLNVKLADEEVDIFDDISQVKDGAPTVQVSIDIEDGKNSVLTAIDRLKFNRSDDFHKRIDEVPSQLENQFGKIFNNIDQGRPLDYNSFRKKYLNSYDEELAKEKKLNFFNQKAFDRKWNMREEYDKNTFAQFEALPNDVKKDLLLTGKNPFNDQDIAQNYSTMPTSMKLAIYKGEMDVPIRHAGNDFFQNKYRESIISNLNRESYSLNRLIDQNVKAPSEYFPIQQKTAYAYEPEKLLELQQREKMIGTLQNELKDLKKKINMMQEKGMSEAINSQQFASFKNMYGEKLKNYNNLLVDKWKQYIPDIRKGHETMIEARRTMYRGADEANLEQVKYPTFFTNDTRNRMHIKLEEHLMDYLDQLRDFKSNYMTRRLKKKNIHGNTIKDLETKIAAIKKDMTNLGLPSRLYDPKTRTFRLYGKAFDNPLQLYKSIQKKNKKLYYINTGLDKDPFTYSKKGTFQKGKNIFLDAGFKDGGFASLEEVLEYNNG